MTATEPRPSPVTGALPGELACHHHHGPPHSQPVNLADWAAGCDARILAEYVYDDGHAYATDLADLATPWLTDHAPAPVRDLLGCPPEAVSYRELAVEVPVLRQWLRTHRPHVQLCAAAAEATASSRWVYDPAHRDLLAGVSADLARDLTDVLAALPTTATATDDPEAVIAAAVTAAGGQATPPPGRPAPQPTGNG